MITEDFNFNIPYDNEKVYLGASRLRILKRDVRERINEACPIRSEERRGG